MCLVVSHSNSTSNHNGHANEYIFAVLFLIPILHQTTTCMAESISKISLFLIPILHQTTTRRLRSGPPIGCFSFQFYIKPQHHVCCIPIAYSCFSFQFYIKPQPAPAAFMAKRLLFLIPILHQTTTSRMAVIHILHVTHMTPMHKTSCRTPGKLVGCNFVFQRAIYQKNSSC